MAKYDILLTSDNTNPLQTIGSVLAHKGYAVKTTTSPEAALEALVCKNYDLVVAGFISDGRASLDILKRAKRLNPEVKVMMVSCKHGTIFPLEAYKIEVDDYLLMPVTPPELWRRVSRCLEGQEIVDLQPVQVAASSGEGDRLGAQVMLTLRDIRGAMVSSAASLKHLARDFHGEMGEEVQAKLQEVSDRIETTGRLIEACIGKPWVDHRPGSHWPDMVDLTEDVVDPVLAELAPEIRARQITLVNRLRNNPEGKIPIRCKKSYLQGVFRNLINNCIAYGGCGCTIVVDLETDESSCRLQVHNTGKTVLAACRSMHLSSSQKMLRSGRSRRGLGFGPFLRCDVIQNPGGESWHEAKADGFDSAASIPQH